MNFSKVKESALKYLGYQRQIIDYSIVSMLDKYLNEIDKILFFKVVYKSFPLDFDPLLIKIINININYSD